MRLLAFVPYVALAVVYNIDQWGEAKLSTYLKPWLMPLLLVGYAIYAGAPKPLILAGLIFGFIGDVALMMPAKGGSQLPMLGGIGAFMLGHIMYIIFCLKRISASLSAMTVVYALALAIIGVYLFKYLKPGIVGIAPAVILYEAVILAMSACAFALVTAKFSAGALIMWLGSVAFVISDSVLAEGMFLKHRPHSGFIVMTTYTLAQLLIALGAAYLP